MTELLMGRKRKHVFKCAASVALLSCVVWLCACAFPGPFDDWWGLLSVCRLCCSPIPIAQRETGQRIRSSEEKYSNYKLQERKHDSGWEVINRDRRATFNVTKLVLKELQEGFFAAITENSDSPFLNAVCVSEPTLLECGSPGFAALLLATLDHVSYCHMLGIHNVMIQWKNCQTSCIKDPQINSWPAYFESLNLDIELNASNVLCLGGLIGGRVLASETARTVKRLNPQQIKQFNWASRTNSLLEVGFRKRQSLPGYEEGAIITSELRKWVNKMTAEYVRPQKSIKMQVDHFYNNNMRGFNVLGVHVRGTDHWVEIEEKVLPLIEQWIQDAQAVLERLEEPKKIFLASDNEETIERFEEYFGKNKVVSTAAKRADKYNSNDPVHSVVTNDAIELGSQVLIDILLLAKCGHFLHAESSVASLAAFFNPEMKLFFLGQLGDDMVNDGSNEEPLPDPTDEITEAKWEADWDEQLKELAQCYEANSPYSTCPNMARGQLIKSKDVRGILAQSK